MTILGLDPGPQESAVVILTDGRVEASDTPTNANMLDWLSKYVALRHDVLVIEGVSSFGMPVGVETFETVFWSGRFAQAFHGRFERIFRRDVKLHLCNSVKAKDANVKQAVWDRFGSSKEKAVGKKSAPGPLYSLRGHEIQALAVALTYAETRTR